MNVLGWAIVIGGLLGLALAVYYPPAPGTLLLLAIVAAAFGSGYCFGAWAILNAADDPEGVN